MGYFYQLVPKPMFVEKLMCEEKFVGFVKVCCMCMCVRDEQC